MATSKFFLLSVVITLLSWNSGSAEISEVSIGLLKEIQTQLQPKLSKECEKKAVSLMSQANSDESIWGMCTLIGSTKTELLNFCTNDEYSTMKNLICDLIKAKNSPKTVSVPEPQTIEPPKAGLKPSVSEGAHQIIEKLNINIGKQVSDQCFTPMKKFLESATNDDMVFRLCSLFRMPATKKVFTGACTVEEMTKIESIICEATAAFTEQSDLGLSKKYQNALDKIQDGLKNLSPKCSTALVLLNKASVNTDEKAAGLCDSIKAARTTIMAICTPDESKLMESTVCNAITSASETPVISYKPNSALSQNARVVLGKIYNSLKDQVSGACSTSVMNAKAFTSSDEIVLNLCSILDLSFAQAIVKKSCSDNESQVVKNTVCKLFYCSE